MTRETRLVAILVGFGAAGTIALAFVAHQYERALPARKAAPAKSSVVPADAAAPLVEAFLAVRQAEGVAAARAGVRPEDRTFTDETLAACRVARLTAAAAHGIDEAAYLRLSDAWRAWTRGEPAPPELASGFTAHRAELARYDALDAAIKR